MSIHEEIAFDKEGKAIPFGRAGELFRRLFIPLIVILVGLLGYGLGRLSGAGQRPPVEVKYDPNIINAESQMTNDKSNPNDSISSNSLDIGHSDISHSGEEVYASSKGTKYYYPGCHNTISAANKVTFASASMAEQAGYTLASGCKP